MLYKKFSVAVVLFLLSLVFMPKVQASVLWYNGDLNNVTAYTSYLVNSTSFVYAYDDFVVGGDGWTVNSVWSNNVSLGDTNITQAYWEIRSGLSANNGGNLIASGTGAATNANTGRLLFGGYTEYSTTVAGLDVSLQPGTYWLTVAPVVMANDGRPYVTTTSGDNAVGLPQGNNWNSYVWDENGFLPTPADSRYDFSMGIGGSRGVNVVPEPASMLLLGGGLFGFALRRKFKV